MAQIFKQSAQAVRKSAFIIPITMVFIFMLVIAGGLFIEDYSTSYLGYAAIPTHKANIWVIYLVALVPQIAQIGFGYIFIDDTRKVWASLIVVAAHFVDASTDIFYKGSGLQVGWWFVAILETELIYTLFSEIMFLAAFGMLIELMPDFIKQTGNAIAAIISTGVAAFTIIVLKLNSEETDNRHGQYTNVGSKRREEIMKQHSNFGDNVKRGRGRPKKTMIDNRPLHHSSDIPAFSEEEFESIG